MTSKAGRRFAFTLTAAFGVIALLAAWRDRDSLSRGAWIMAALLLAAGTLVPTRLGPIERSWMKFGLLLSRITSPVFLGVVYFVVITPAGLIRRMLGKNAIAHRAISSSYWKPRAVLDPEVRRRGMERQF